MKKIFISLICCFILVMTSTVFAENSRVLNTNGTIVAAEENRVVVQGTGNIDNIVLFLQGKTYIVDNATMQKVQKIEIKKGDYVYAFYGANMTKSIPPQAKAVLLVLGKGDSSIAYMRISQVEDKGDYVKVYYDNQSMDIDEKAMPSYKSIRQGDELLGWYTATAASVPTSFKASHAMVLNRTVVENLTVSFLTGNILVENKQLPLTEKNKIYSVNGVTYLPLRTIAEILGYSTTWNAVDKSIKLQKASKSARLQVGNRGYWQDKERIILENVPLMIDGQTLVPLDFFKEVLDENVKVKA
ncbi:MAG: stalk domain-containing protein [Acidaminococcaceae bacterium]|nr:stalk domain-containing protein [Acidaminococcaceae bacterium]MDD4722205.1 stalk domain-containing protein [Acidaminococcaceae bacterium]